MTTENGSSLTPLFGLPVSYFGNWGWLDSCMLRNVPNSPTGLVSQPLKPCKTQDHPRPNSTRTSLFGLFEVKMMKFADSLYKCKMLKRAVPTSDILVQA